MAQLTEETVRKTTDVKWVAYDLLKDDGTHGLFPAFFVGYLIAMGHPLRSAGRTRNQTVYSEVAIDIGCGGYGCLTAQLRGQIFPLRDNLHLAIGDSEGSGNRPVDVLLATLNRRSQPMEGNPSEQSILPLPWKPIGRGDELTSSELTDFYKAISHFYPVPVPHRGWEALLDFGPIDPQWLMGWTAAEFATSGDQFARRVGCFKFDSSATQRLERAVTRASAAVPKPHLWLVWENCD